jgi:DeoR family fructose operon transcriptional repressor
MRNTSRKVVSWNIPADRHKHILDLIRKGNVVQVTELAAYFQVSELTIRRDLDQLAAKGLVERTHGGATSRRNLPVEPDYMQKSSEYQFEKQMIGRTAARLVEEGDTVYINSGSTTLEVIRSLVASNRKISIVTNNIDAVWLVKEDSPCKLILAGGVVRPRSHSVSGSLSQLVLDQVFANKAIIGVDGFSLAAGLTTPVLEEAETTRAMIEKTVGTVIVVAAGNKIGVVSNFKTVGLDHIDVLITDESGGKLLAEDATGNLEVIVATDE